MRKKALITFIFSLFLFTSISIHATSTSVSGGTDSKSKAVLFENHISNLYNAIAFKESQPDYKLFRKSYIGYLNLKAANKLSDKNILTIIDFRLSSTKNRFWSIDLDHKQVLYESLVAHGRNSGEEFAEKFSNVNESNMSSFGFYVTGDTYIGKHGLSLYLDGVDTGFNCNARTRAVVMHSADYVNQDFVKEHGRLGRSLGCPAIPVENHEEVINTLQAGTCLFIYFPDKQYEKKSKLLSTSMALNYFLMNQSVNQSLSSL